MKAHDRLTDASGDYTSDYPNEIIDGFWSALRPAVSKGTYQAIKDDYAQNNNTSWRCLYMIASDWVSWL